MNKDIKKNKSNDFSMEKFLQKKDFFIYPSYFMDRENTVFSDGSLTGFEKKNKYLPEAEEFCFDCLNFLVHIHHHMTADIDQDKETLELILSILKMNSRFLLFQEFQYAFNCWKNIIENGIPTTSSNFLDTLLQAMRFLYQNIDKCIQDELIKILFNYLCPTYELFNRPVKIKKQYFLNLYYKIVKNYLSFYQKCCIERYKENEESQQACGLDLDYLKETNELVSQESRYFNFYDKKTETNSKELFFESIKHIESIIKSDKKYSGVASGFESLDDLTDGYQNGELIIIGARSSVGKTAFAINNALNIADDLENENKKVLFFSLEMPAIQLGKRMISIKTDIDLLKIRSANLSIENLQEIVRSTGCVNDNIIINDKCGITTSDIDMMCSAHKDLCCVFIDYMQIIKPDSKSYSKVDEIGKISMDLKNMAKKYNVPFVVLSQLSRAPEGRDNKRPILSDLRDSGSIEQDADMVILLYREEYYLKRSMETGNQKKNNEIEERLKKVEGKAEIIIAKQRNGPIENVLLKFSESTGKFENI